MFSSDTDKKMGARCPGRFGTGSYSVKKKTDKPWFSLAVGVSGVLAGLLAAVLVFAITIFGDKPEAVKQSRAVHQAERQAQFAARNGTLSKAEIRKHVLHASRKYSVAPELLWAVISVESSFNPAAKSPAGAIGLMQLMPATARSIGVKNPWDPAENIKGGARYMRDLLRQFKGRRQIAIAAYNAGPGAVRKYGGIPPFPETRVYVERVMKAYNAEMAKRKPKPVAL